MANKRYFTVTRQLHADSDMKPDALLFAGHIDDKDINEELAKKLMASAPVRALMPQGKPLLAVIYTKPETDERRVVVSALSYYPPSLQAKHADYTIVYEEPGGEYDGRKLFGEDGKELPMQRVKVEPTVRTVRYGELLENCMESWQPVGCEGCPYKGLDCVKINVGYRPWIFDFAYNRRDEFSQGLIQEGSVEDRNAYVAKHALACKDYDELVKGLTKQGELEGFAFMPPNKTTRDNTVRMKRALRPPMDHALLKNAAEAEAELEKAEKPTKKAAKAAK